MMLPTSEDFSVKCLKNIKINDFLFLREAEDIVTFTKKKSSPPTNPIIAQYMVEHYFICFLYSEYNVSLL